MKIELTDEKIILFYQKHPEINVTDVNLFMINFMDNFFLNSEQSKNENISEIMLKKLSKLESFFTENNDTDNYKSTINDIVRTNIQQDRNVINDNISQALQTNSQSNINNLVHEIKQPISNIVKENLVNVAEMTNNIVSNSETRMVSQISALQTTIDRTNITQEHMDKTLTDYTNKLTNSSLKGQISEKKLMIIMEEMYGQDCLEEVIEKTANTKKSGDIILNRYGKSKLLIENKNYGSKKIPEEEVEKFIRDIDEQKCNGLMLSQETEISGKKTFQIDIHKQHILIYVDKVNYDNFKIRLAIDIIDKLHSKLSPYLNQDTAQESNYKIQKEMLESINNEFEKFIKSKEEFYTEIQDTHKKLIKRLNELEFPCLDGYLKNIFATSHKNVVECEICGKNFFGRQPAKALARHLPACKKKQEKINKEEKLQIIQSNQENLEIENL